MYSWLTPEGIIERTQNQEEPAKLAAQCMISWNAILAIAYKEFVHVWRDRRVMLLIVVLPPFFTFLFGHAFENSTIRDVPAMYFDADHSQQSQEFLALLKAKDIFDWKPWHGDPKARSIFSRPESKRPSWFRPAGAKDCCDGDPKPIRAVLDGSDTNTAPSVQGALQETLGDYQSKQRDNLIENLPDEVIDLGKQLPVEIRHEFSSMMTPWDVKIETLYNPNLLVHRLRDAGHRRPHLAVDHGDFDCQHDHARTRSRNLVPTNGHAACAKQRSSLAKCCHTW